MYTIKNTETRTIKFGGRKSNWSKIVQVRFIGNGSAIVSRLGKSDKVYSPNASRHIRNALNIH